MKKFLGFLVLLGFLGASDLPIDKVKLAKGFPDLVNAVTLNGVVKVVDVSFKCFKEHKDLREQGIYVTKAVSSARENGDVLSNLLLMDMFHKNVFERCGDYNNGYLNKIKHSVEHNFMLSMDLLGVIIGIANLPFYPND